MKIFNNSKFRKVLAFSMTYRFVMQWLISPILLFGMRRMLRFYNVQFLSTEALLDLMSKPGVWLFMIISLVIISYLLLIELAALTLLGEYDELTDSVFMTSHHRVMRLLKSSNILFVPLILIVLLGFHWGMNSMVSESLFIPEFIMDTIMKTPKFLNIYLLVLAVSFVLAFHWVFLFHGLFLGKLSIKESLQESYYHVKKHRLNFFMDSLIMNLKLGIFSFVIYGVLLALTIFGAYVIPPSFELSALSISIVFMFNKFYLLILITVGTSVNVMFLNKKYNEYGGEVAHMAIFHEPYKAKKHKLQFAIFMLLAFTIVLQSISAYHQTILYSSSDYLAHQIQVTSHRGNSSVAPENTVSAIKAAKKEKADYAEIDVQLTKDKEVVVIHDFTLKRLAHDSRSVKDVTLKEIKELEVGSWFSPEFKGEKIPTLKEVIEESGIDLHLNIELKPSGNADELAKAVVEILDEMKYNEFAVISSLDRQALHAVKKYNSNLQVGFIVPVALGKFENDDSLDFYSLEMSFMSKNLVQRIKDQGKEIHVWLVNSEEDMEKMQVWQVDNIITDNPMLAKKVLSTSVIEKGILELLTLLEI
ncbi:glycerophosphodiester phosphodiesterase family protein [Erysipelothrix urinaevulpis]|uniref:glycerophosphodiester phosphodiesterase family protein n=1 Tax=Erysipelothrix urinaevulpis TaxID=2683717 RepID=UPI0013578A8F|nr:glycerophosphodiester phosphodiesterase family protein [Erysipelothrix urinaevulpis]